MPVKHKDTGETFKFEVEPTPSLECQYIIDTDNIKMYRQNNKCYIYDHATLEEIDPGAFNNAIQSIAGLSDEAAADRIKTLFRSGAIKSKESFQSKRFKVHGNSNSLKFHNKTTQKRPTQKYGSYYKF